MSSACGSAAALGKDMDMPPEKNDQLDDRRAFLLAASPLWLPDPYEQLYPIDAEPTAPSSDDEDHFKIDWGDGSDAALDAPQASADAIKSDAPTD